MTIYATLSFRWGFDPFTGTLYLGDVGENQYEEFNVIRAGENYGWPVMEGEDCFLPPSGCDTAGLTLPIDIKTHSGDGVAAIVGGYVSYSSAVPELYGMYIYSDAFAGKVWGLRYDGTNVSDKTLLAEAGNFSPYGFGRDQDGEVYALDADGGEIWVLRPAEAQPANDFPLTLSAIPALLDAGLGLNQTYAGILPYEPSAKLWSDGALKERFMALPGLDQATFELEGGFGFPDDTVLIKNFVLPMDFRNPEGATRRVETRLLINNGGVWRGFSYFWNDDETDAQLLPGSATRDFTLIDENGVLFDYAYYYPSRSECLRCHTNITNNVAGITAAQMNFPFRYPESGVKDNQLRTLEHIGFFDAPLPERLDALPAAPDPADVSATFAKRAEAYLFANCAMCHQPGGPAPVNIDFRWGLPLDARFIFDVAPTHETLGITNARRLAPGDPDRSVIAARMAHTGEFRMPPLATSRVDEDALAVVRRWIELTTSVTGADHIWIDFDYTGVEVGTEPQPFDTFAEGLSAVRDGGRLHLAPGTTSERPSISQRVTLTSTGGVVRIGN